VSDPVSPGDTLLVVEAMKMEYALRAPFAGEVEELLVRVGDQVVLDQVVARVRPRGDEVPSPNDQG
jgi:acetyl-CoA/propionyl-CoA carboxylase biotin carboxyl carrier protein